MNSTIEITEEIVINKILFIRGKKVMLDRDLAELYGVQTKRLNEQVKRNIKRFPEDFMFQLTEIENHNLMSQNATSRYGGIRKLPYVFTEQGVAMLSGILNSETAIEVNIKIIRVFIRMREILFENKDILLKLEQMERIVTEQNGVVNKHEQDIQLIFSALKELLNPTISKRKPIGFKTTD